MEKGEEIFKQSFDIDLGDYKIHEQKSNKSKIIKISAIIVAGIALITTVALLIAHFKYGAFYSEIYQVGNIKREIYSADYFTEEKIFKTKMGYINGENVEQEQLITTNFVVLVTDREEFKVNGKIDYINTAFLVQLDSKLKMNDKEVELGSLNIFDENAIKDFESNPDGEKHPFAYFKFYENGTLININLPKQTNSLDAENIINLVNNVIPQLTRNRTDDKNNGIEIKTRTDKKKKTFAKFEPPKEYLDKYTKFKFRGSKVSKLVETDVEDEKIKEIRSNTNLYLQTQKNEDNTNHFGLEDFKFDLSSKIKATKNDKQKIDDAKLIEKLASKLEFIDSEKLMESLLIKEGVVKDSGEETAVEEPKQRNLGVNAKLYWEWVLFNKDILGQEVSASYIVDFTYAKITNKIQLKAGPLTLALGNKYGVTNQGGKNADDSGSSKDTDITLCTIPIYGVANLKIKISFSVSYGFKFETSNDITVKLNGKVDLKAEIDLVAKFGVRGNMIDADFKTKFGKVSGKYSQKDFCIEIGAGAISGYVTASIGGFNLFNAELKIWEGFGKKRIV